MTKAIARIAVITNKITVQVAFTLVKSQIKKAIAVVIMVSVFMCTTISVCYSKGAAI